MFNERVYLRTVPLRYMDISSESPEESGIPDPPRLLHFREFLILKRSGTPCWDPPITIQPVQWKVSQIITHSELSPLWIDHD